MDPLLADKPHKFQHIMREGNRVVNYLANTTINKETNIFVNFNSIESTDRRLINSDKLQCPYLRVSPNKG